MRLSLINTPIDLKQLKGLRKPVYDTLFYNSAPLGLAYLAATLLQHGHEPFLIDAPVEQLDNAGVVQRLQTQKPDMVGISSTSVGFYGALNLAKAIKQWKPKLPVLIGGPHVSAVPQETMQERCFDYGFIGESEKTLIEFLEVWSKSENLIQVDGLVWRANGELVFSRPRKPIANLDSIPMPARHLLPIERYRPVPIDARTLPKLTLMSSRGCPYTCIFCDKSVFGRSYRMFSPKRVSDELETLVKTYGAKDFAFLDSLFNLTTDRVNAILDELQRRQLAISWSCSVRVDALTYDLLARMKQCGCWRVRIGIESGHPEVLKFINKEITIEQIRTVTMWADELGLQPKAFFMIGHLVDTKETIEASMRFAQSIPLKDITVQINTILRNTKQYELFKHHGHIIEDQPDHYSFWQPMFIPQGLTRAELEKLHSKFYRSFYLRPSVFWRHLKNIRSFHMLWVYLSSLKLPLSLFTRT